MYQIVETLKDWNFWGICVIGFAITSELLRSRSGPASFA